MVAADLRRRGHRILFPYGEDCDYDLVVERPDGRFERVQVKYTESDGRVRATKHYTSASIDWLAVFDTTTARCYYVPAAELGSGRAFMHLRVTPARNNQRTGVRPAADYLSF